MYKKMVSEALELLRNAASQSIEGLVGSRVQCWLWYCIALGARDRALACEWADKAVSLCKKTSEAVGDLELVIALGEAGIAHGIQGNFKKAFECFDEAFKIFLKKEPAEENQIQRFVSLALSIGYFTQVCEGGRKLAPRLAQPSPGQFLIDKPALVKNYSPMFIAESMALLSNFANLVGETQRAADLSIRALDLARSRKQWNVIAMSGMQMLYPLLSENKFAEAIDIALESMSALEATKSNAGMRTAEKRTTFEECLGKKPSDKWSLAEQNALGIVLPPLIFRLGIMRLQGVEIVQQVRLVVKILREMARSASDQKVFNSVAQIIEHAFGSEGSEVEYRKMSLEGGEIAQVIGYVAISERSDVTPELVLRCHLLSLPKAIGNFPEDTLMNEKLIYPYLEEYWTCTFKNQRFRFTAPRSVETELKQLQGLRGKVRLLHLLSTLANGLGISFEKIPKAQKDWFFSSETNPSARTQSGPSADVTS